MSDISEEPQGSSTADSNANVSPGPAQAATSAGDVHAAGDVNFINQFFEDAERTSSRSFAADDAWTFSNEQEAEIVRLFIGEDTIQNVAENLNKRRILLLTGDRAIGKGTTALFLGTCISDQNDLERCALVVDPLDRDVRISLRRIADDPKRFGERVTIFRDAFKHGNRELLTFFAHVDRVGWEQLSNSLKNNRSYLIITAATPEATRLRQHAACVAYHELAPLTLDLVQKGFSRKIEFIEERKLASSMHIDALKKHAGIVFAELGRLPAIAAFIDEFVRGDTDVLGTLAKFKNIHYWLLKVVGSDLEAWCFVLALALGQPTPESDSISWLDFHLLHSRIAQRIRAGDDVVSRHNESAPDDPEEEWTNGHAWIDDEILQRCRAEVVKDRDRLGDVVRFVDRETAADVWKVLLTRCRRVLTSIVPVLRKIAEQERSRGRSSARVLAAQAVGRIGEIDPLRLTLPLLRHWALDPHHRPLIGRLVQGALASENDTYGELCLRELELFSTPGALEGNAEIARYRLITAIAAYSLVGQYRLSRAMARLGAIAIEQIAPVMQNYHDVSRSVEDADLRASRTRRRRNAAALQARRNRLATLAQNLFDAQAAAVIALDKAIVELCLVDDAVETLTMMGDWISRGGFGTGLLVAFLFLHGVAEELRSIAVEVESTDEHWVSNPLLVSLASNSNAVPQFAAFLADIRATIGQTFKLPATLQHDYQERFSEMLVSLATDAVASGPCRAAVIDLFAALAAARNGAFHDEIYDLLGTAPFLEFEDMRKLAVDIRKRIG